jgi:predicted RND superfamily exporter protein
MFYSGGLVESTHRDFNAALLLSSLFVLAVLLLSFRNLWVSLLAFLPMALSWYVVQGWMALLGLEFNLINIVLSTFIFGIGVDYSIFVMQGLLAGARGQNSLLLEQHKTAIFFSAFVLLVVMLSLLVAMHPAIRSIGLCSIIGMGTTILISYSLQPLLFRQLLKVPFIRKSILREVS